MDRLSNALTLFGVVLIIGGVAVMVVAVVWLRREQDRARLEVSQARSRPPAPRLEIRRSALLAETMPLPAVPVPGAIGARPAAGPPTLTTQAAGPPPSPPRFAAAPRPARSATRSRPGPPKQSPPPPASPHQGPPQSSPQRSGASNGGAWPANAAAMTPNSAPSSTTAPSSHPPLGNGSASANPAEAGRPGPNAGPVAAPVTAPGVTVRRGPWPPPPARHPIIDPSRRPH